VGVSTQLQRVHSAADLLASRQERLERADLRVVLVDRDLVVGLENLRRLELPWVATPRPHWRRLLIDEEKLLVLNAPREGSAETRVELDGMRRCLEPLAAAR
jgi:hypothetical protein